MQYERFGSSPERASNEFVRRSDFRLEWWFKRDESSYWYSPRPKNTETGARKKVIAPKSSAVCRNGDASYLPKLFTRFWQSYAEMTESSLKTTALLVYSASLVWLCFTKRATMYWANHVYTLIGFLLTEPSELRVEDEKTNSNERVSIYWFTRSRKASPEDSAEQAC